MWVITKILKYRVKSFKMREVGFGRGLSYDKTLPRRFDLGRQMSVGIQVIVVYDSVMWYTAFMVFRR
jgi:hypothetical protein